MTTEDRVEELETNLATTIEELHSLKSIVSQVLDVLGGNFDEEILAQISAEEDLVD
jgi:hypothetical protein